VGKKKLIVIWPYRFRDFDWQRFELDFLAPHVEIHVHELIDALTPEFGAAYANQSENPAVKRFASLKEWRKEFKKISEDAIVFNHVRPINLKSTLICATLRRSRAKIIQFFLGAVPFADVSFKPKFMEVPNSFKVWYHFLRRKILFFSMPHEVLVGGAEGCRLAKREFSSKVNLKIGSSFDFSNSKTLDLRKVLGVSFGVYLDVGFPGFRGDSIMEGKKTTVDPDHWYVRLNSLFGIIEDSFGLSVHVLAHPKHWGRDYSQFFGSRKVIGNQTASFVKGATLVVSLTSTSISYAVMFNKPIFLVTSDQIQNGPDQYNRSLIANISVETGARIFNIDREYTEQDLREAMVIDHAKYESYKRKYLTSRTDGKPNYQVLLDEVIFAED
jgi:hypothetical protein